MATNEPIEYHNHVAGEAIDDSIKSTEQSKDDETGELNDEMAPEARTTTTTITTTASSDIVADESNQPTATSTDTSNTITKSSESIANEKGDNDNKKGDAGEDEELEEGELKDDDDDDDDDDDPDEDETSKRIPNYNNDNNNNNNNNGGFTKESSYNEHRQHDPHQNQNYNQHYSASSGSAAPGQPPSHLYNQHLHPNRRLSPNSQHLAEMHGQYPPNHQFGNNSNHNHYRYAQNDGPPPPPMGHHPMMVGPGAMYPRGGPGGVGPMQKVNAKCRFYSKTSNKCTWGDHCRFEHRDDSPGPEFEGRSPGPTGMGPSSSRSGVPPGAPPMQPMPMGPAERGGPPPYPPYPGRHQPYPPMPPHGYPYEPYGHHSTPPPLPPHPMSHWRQHSPYPSPSSAHPPESVSPALLPTPAGGVPPGGPSSSRGGGQPIPPGSGSGSSSGSATANAGPPAAGGGAPSPNYPPPSSSAVVYERKHRLAYELAPWNNDRGSGGNYPPPTRYDRVDPSGYVGRGGFYRNHYSRELPYGREQMPHMGGPYPGYTNYPSAYRGGPIGPHASQYNKYMSSSQRTVPPDSRRSRSNKRGHDEDESSWSDSGSEDSILGQASYGNKSHAHKISKQQHHQQTTASENPTSDEPIDQGSGTPPGEPLPEDRERQEMLLNKLKEIEDLMAKKKGEQEDPM